ncbi:MAG TPA: hypothetical protein DDX19_10590 [Rhodopirellula baltica]|uniref:Uncharacterized protein n=2 Tax=Rhodopirellula baltica TaxID=265606 RepID=F2AUD6_RHOBT|nr:hypothetical protein RBWH47_00328 [Rhodopirellula baltica WH47]ELP33303.1 hypothetical protein RBSWK_02800 [Rhodopirellula baltica SWK14]HBE63167.1 hypothetical protein [Rhodopirellula baltica]
MARTEGVAPVSPVVECTQGDANRLGCEMGSDKILDSPYNIRSGVRLGDCFSPSAPSFRNPICSQENPCFPA